MSRRITVFGPAYLDRVMRVDQPLHDPETEAPLDQSVDGVWRFTGGSTLRLRDPSGFEIDAQPPANWPGPFGEIVLNRTLRTGKSVAGIMRVQGIGWNDDLGGMGAGFASVLKGTLVCALGAETDPTSQAVWSYLNQAGIDCQPIRVERQAADWTLLISSGTFGDKLPIGFRGCHAAIDLSRLEGLETPGCEVMVVASLPNAISEALREARGKKIKAAALLGISRPTLDKKIEDYGLVVEKRRS